MTDDDRDELVASTGATLFKADSPVRMPSTRAEWDAHYRHLVRVVMAAIEPAIRADESRRVVEDAASDDAVERALRAYLRTLCPPGALPWHVYRPTPREPEAMRSAIRAALDPIMLGRPRQESMDAEVVG